MAVSFCSGGDIFNTCWLIWTKTTIHYFAAVFILFIETFNFAYGVSLMDDEKICNVYDEIHDLVWEDLSITYDPPIVFFFPKLKSFDKRGNDEHQIRYRVIC